MRQESSDGDTTQKDLFLYLGSQGYLLTSFNYISKKSFTKSFADSPKKIAMEIHSNWIQMEFNYIYTEKLFN